MKKDKFIKFIHLVEDLFVSLCFIVLIVLPLIEIVLRIFFKTGIPNSSGLITHFVLAISFIGGMITSREDKHLAITALIDFIKEPLKSNIKIVTSFISVMIVIAFGVSSLSLTLNGYDPNLTIGFIPIQFFAILMPIGFFTMAIRFALNCPKKKWIPLLGIILGFIISYQPFINILQVIFPGLPSFFNESVNTWYNIVSYFVTPSIILLIISGVFGVPLFIVLGGIGFLLFIRSQGALEVIANEAYTMLIGSAIPAVPLFTIAGFFLSESKAGERLVKLFMALFGWLPGGIIIATVLVCTFFTTFTGTSGVTILALGALLGYILIHSGKYNEDLSCGLITGVGSIGLMFPPSLAIIIYGTIAGVSIYKMFIGSLLPGAILVISMCALGIILTPKTEKVEEPIKFDIRKILSSIKESIWEILLPIIITVAYFSGTMTIVETGALAALYSFIIETFIHKEINLKDLRKIIIKSTAIIGGVLMILALARGLSYYIIDAEIPTHITNFVKTYIKSKYLFLFVLNIILLIVGCFMDIFSAIMVVVPLITPIGQFFNINPVHLGVIFLVNLGIGFLTPPVGMNLFLASYRFERPLVKIYKDIFPFFIVQLIVLLIVTYIPWFSTVFVK